jgi:hypothetical protein
MESWHVATTRPGRQRQAVDGLLSLGEFVEEVYAPSRVAPSFSRGAVVRRESFWLGPIVLARWDAADPYAWHAICDLAAVSGIFGGGYPSPVPDEHVEITRRRIAVVESGAARLAPAPCSAGDLVQFSHLAFYDQTGTAVEVDVGFVCVEISLLGFPTVIPVPFDAIDRVVERAAERETLSASSEARQPYISPQRRLSRYAKRLRERARDRRAVQFDPSRVARA